MGAREKLWTGLEGALTRRDLGPIGTPLQHDYLRAYSEPVLVPAETFWGDPMVLSLPELVSCEIHRYGVIEPGLTALFIEEIAVNSVVFDVGAHLGYFSLLAAALGAEVHAFEPARRTASLLEQNVDDRVTVVRAGLWSVETELPFQDFGTAHSAVNTFVVSRDDSVDEPETRYQVDVTTIDAYVAATGRIPALIKIDAEGAELEVLRGAVDTLTGARPLLTIEVGDAEPGESRRAIDFATSLGYDPYTMTPEGRHRHEKRAAYSYGNLLLAPRGKDKG